MRLSSHGHSKRALLLLLLPTLLDAKKQTFADPAPHGYEEWTSPIVYPSPNITGSNGWAAALVKAKAFVEDLTLAELINVTTGVGFGAGRCVGNTGTIARKGFAGLCLEDSPTGVRPTDFASAFPAGLNSATTWDKILIWKRGAAMGAEYRGKGVNVALGPMMNLARAPAGGRIFEGAGGDPYLAGVVSAETVKGIQSQGVIACAKHFIGNEQDTYRGPGGTTSESSNIDDRTLHEVYAWPFAASVEAGLGSVMCSYNRVNQTHSCQNSKLLNGILKDELDFQGFVVTDWLALESDAPSALAGLDMDMPGYTRPSVINTTAGGDWYWGDSLTLAVLNGSVPLTRVQDMVTRTMAAYFQMGQDDGFPSVNFDANTEDTYYGGVLVNEHIDVQDDHRDIIREIGAASAVLLQNVNATLPLSPSTYRRWGIFGSDAGPNFNGPNGCSSGDCQTGTLAMGWGSGAINFPYLVDPLSAIQAYIHATNRKAVIEGMLNDTNYEQAQSVARQADICLVFVNADSGEGTDRTNLTLWHSGEALIANVTSQCDNTVVVLHTAGTVTMESWVENPNITAIVYAGLPGQMSYLAMVSFSLIEGPQAFEADSRLIYLITKSTRRGVLRKLSQRKEVTMQQTFFVRHASPEFSRQLNELSPIDNSSMTVPQITYTEELLIDYRWFDAKDITPRFEFGFGLSYTTFEYSALSIASASTRYRRGLSLLDVAYSISFTVTNTGNYDGHEVSQLYLGFPSSAGEPPKVLRGFEKTYVKKGASATVSLSLQTKDISVWDVVTQAWVVPSGEISVMIGQSSRNIKLTTTFTH
ncbi:beta-glucosidase, partial [Phenoliferia sp. Uapishka_3]